MVLYGGAGNHGQHRDTDTPESCVENMELGEGYKSVLQACCCSSAIGGSKIVSCMSMYPG
jgi:hypothetical protein